MCNVWAAKNLCMQNVWRVANEPSLFNWTRCYVKNSCSHVVCSFGGVSHEPLHSENELCFALFEMATFAPLLLLAHMREREGQRRQ